MNKDKKARIDRAVSLYQTGLTAKEVANIMGLEKSTIGKYLKSARISVRGIKKYSTTLVDSIDYDYQSGMTAKEISVKYQISYQKVRSLLNNYGITRKEVEQWV